MSNIKKHNNRSRHTVKYQNRKAKKNIFAARRKSPSWSLDFLPYKKKVEHRGTISICRSVGRSIGRSVGRSVGLLVCWSVGWLVGWSVSCGVGVFAAVSA